MLVAGFDLATGFLPGALVREYGSRTSTEAGGHRRGASCIGSTVLRAPEVLVGCGARAHDGKEPSGADTLPDGGLGIGIDPSPARVGVEPAGERRVGPEDDVVDGVSVEEHVRIGLEGDRLGIAADGRVTIDVGSAVDKDACVWQLAAQPAAPGVDVEDPRLGRMVLEPGAGANRHCLRDC